MTNEEIIKGNNENLTIALKAMRNNRGLKQSDVAQVLGISTSSYSHYECGINTPDISLVMKLCRFYKINIMHMIFIMCLDSIVGEDMEIDILFQVLSYGYFGNRDEYHLIEAYRSLPPVYKRDISQFVSATKKCFIRSTLDYENNLEYKDTDKEPDTNPDTPS